MTAFLTVVSITSVLIGVERRNCQTQLLVQLLSDTELVLFAPIVRRIVSESTISKNIRQKGSSSTC